MTPEYLDNHINERGYDNIGNLPSEDWAKLWEEALSAHQGKPLKVKPALMDDATWERYIELANIVNPISDDEPWTPQKEVKHRAASLEMCRIVWKMSEKK